MSGELPLGKSTAFSFRRLGVSCVPVVVDLPEGSHRILGTFALLQIVGGQKSTQRNDPTHLRVIAMPSTEP